MPISVMLRSSCEFNCKHLRNWPNPNVDPLWWVDHLNTGFLLPDFNIQFLMSVLFLDQSTIAT